MALQDFALGLGVGSLVGAVTILMLPRHSDARRLAETAACRTEAAISDMIDRMN